eukprot:10601925-Heterocapsa_arctica.AAC.1
MGTCIFTGAVVLSIPRAPVASMVYAAYLCTVTRNMIRPVGSAAIISHGHVLVLSAVASAAAGLLNCDLQTPGNASDNGAVSDSGPCRARSAELWCLVEQITTFHFAFKRNVRTLL